MEQISVVIPVYNVEEYLERCLESVVSQTYKALEIICINDGSTDNSLEICQEFQKRDNRIRIVDQENKGLAAVRNIGIREATSDYLYFIDSDDYIDTDFVEKLYVALKTNEADIAVSNVRYENTKTAHCLIKDLVTNKTVLNRIETMQEYLNPTGGLGNYLVNKLYRKEMFDGISFPESKLFEDASTMFRILNNVNKTVIEQDVYYHYWIREDSITGSYGPETNNFDLLDANKVKTHFVCENYNELSSLVFYQYFSAFSWYLNRSALLKIDNNIQLRGYLKDLSALKNKYNIKMTLKHKVTYAVMCFNLNLYRMIYRLLKKEGV